MPKPSAHIWADRYERDLSDIFALQDEITQRIVQAIGRACVPGDQAGAGQAHRKPAPPMTSSCARCRTIHAQNKESVKRAEALLRKAVELDPDYAEALGMLADIIATPDHERLAREPDARSARRPARWRAAR